MMISINHHFMSILAMICWVVPIHTADVEITFTWFFKCALGTTLILLTANIHV